MPGASAGSGYAANAGQFGNIGTGTAAGSAAASGYPLKAAIAPQTNWAGLFAGVTGFGQIASAYSQSQAQASEGKFQASIFESNARLQALQAEDAIIRGDKEAVKAKQLAKRIIGSQRAAMGAQGIDLESGSALDIQKETAALGAEDALNIKNNAWREAWGYKVQENDLYGRAKYARITAKNTSRNTLLTGGLSALKTFSDYQYKKKYGSNSLEDYLTNYGAA